MKVRRHRSNPDSYIIFDEHSDIGNNKTTFVQDGTAQVMDQLVIDVAREKLQPGEEGTVLLSLDVIKSRGV